LEKSVRIAEGREEMDSILSCYYSGEESQEHSNSQEYRRQDMMLHIASSETIPTRGRQHNN